MNDKVVIVPTLEKIRDEQGKERNLNKESSVYGMRMTTGFHRVQSNLEMKKDLEKAFVEILRKRRQMDRQRQQNVDSRQDKMGDIRSCGNSRRQPEVEKRQNTGSTRTVRTLSSEQDMEPASTLNNALHSESIDLEALTNPRKLSFSTDGIDDYNEENETKDMSFSNYFFTKKTLLVIVLVLLSFILLLIVAMIFRSKDPQIPKSELLQGLIVPSITEIPTPAPLPVARPQSGAENKFSLWNEGHSNDKCSGNTDCSEGTCVGFSSGVEGICTNGSVGSKCVAQGDCQSGRCIRGFCMEKQEPGRECRGNQECASGVCFGWSELTSGICIDTSDENRCTQDKECGNGACEGGFCKTFSLSRGKVCIDNSDCVSNDCTFAAKQAARICV